MGGVDDDDELEFRDVIRAIASTTWADAPPRMTKAAWRMLSDDDAPLLGDDLPNLDMDDGSTQWNIGLKALTADFGNGRTALIAVPAFGSFLPTTLTLLEYGNAVHEGVAKDTLNAMELADDEAAARGWLLGDSMPFKPS